MQKYNDLNRIPDERDMKYLENYFVRGSAVYEAPRDLSVDTVEWASSIEADPSLRNSPAKRQINRMLNQGSGRGVNMASVLARKTQMHKP